MATLPSLNGNVTTVTGASRGIGGGIAVELAARGASVVVAYSASGGPRSELLRQIETTGSRAFALQADCSDVPQIATLFEKALGPFGKIDTAVSNAGIEGFGQHRRGYPGEV